MTKSVDVRETAKLIRAGAAVQVAQPNTALSVADRSYPAPEGHEVRLKVEACGVCHSDSFPILGHFPGIKYPIVPGHEIVGIVDEVGPRVKRLKKGDRVGVGWHGGHCNECDRCRKGDFITCQNGEIPGITRDGGYAHYAIFHETVCAPVPAEISSAEAAPLMCAGVTTYNALRHAGARPGDVVAILGLGGLGHLGVMFASKMGFKTIAIARGSDKASFANQLGAHEYIDSQSKDATEQLKKLGGATVLLSTVTNAKAMAPWVDALTVGGKMVIVGADVEPIPVSPLSLLGARRSIAGWPSGTARDSEDCLKFAALTGIRPIIEKFPFEKAGDAYERMMSGKARFRAVIEIC